MGDGDFRSKYEWFIATDRHQGDDWSRTPPDEIERLYREAHPPKVTAEDVLREFNAILGTPPYRKLPAYVERMAGEIADLRNAAREDEDEAWMAIAANSIYDAPRRLGYEMGAWIGTTRVTELIRAAYRSRSKA